jgi:UDP-GlcNAc3NAcA epimerase
MLLPLHPRTRKTLQREQIVPGGRVTLLQPASYFAMLGYLERCRFVVTDSGGVQKEAYFLGKRCITVRDETEWTELVACGANRLAGADAAAISDAFAWAMEPLGATRQLYGQGDAAGQIVEILSARANRGE